MPTQQSPIVVSRNLDENDDDVLFEDGRPLQFESPSPTKVATVASLQTTTTSTTLVTPMALTSAIHRKQPIGATNASQVSPPIAEIANNEPQRLYKVEKYIENSNEYFY